MPDVLVTMPSIPPCSTTFVSPEFDVVVDRLGTYTLYLKEMESEILGRILS